MSRRYHKRVGCYAMLASAVIWLILGYLIIDLLNRIHH